MMITLKDIAKKAGVSVSTVSRVLNMKYPNAASKETQERIWKIVHETGYIPNIHAQYLKMGEDNSEPHETPRSIFCVYARSSRSAENPFFSEIGRSIEYEAYKHNCLVKYSYLGNDQFHPHITKQLIDIKTDGVIMIGRYDEKLLYSFLRNYKNVVYTGLNKIDTKYDQVICDGYEAAGRAVKYLYDLGHRKIAYIGETKSETRFLGYKDTLNSLNLHFDKKNIVNAKQTPDGGYVGAEKLINMSNNFSAVFCANDVTAIGALRAFKKFDIKIPEDVSIISVDDIEMAQYSSPMLTTVHIPTDELGKIAMKILLDRITSGTYLPLKITLPFRIVERESCAQPSKKWIQ
jgi:DNA-binding LacI/PurR family transcriptional regulator